MRKKIALLYVFGDVLRIFCNAKLTNGIFNDAKQLLLMGLGLRSNFAVQDFAMQI
jgi:hypothetical protein